MLQERVATTRPLNFGSGVFVQVRLSLTQDSKAFGSLETVRQLVIQMPS